MAQDIVADALNQIKNASRAKKETLVIKRSSKFLLEILNIMKLKHYLKGYKIDENKKTVEITIGNLIECKAVKPRYHVRKNEIEKYMRRYLPSRDLGVIIISTDIGLITHEEAIEKNIGGSLIAVFY